jgi:DNA-binding winged helix-turn-helix (wHTH) protein
MDQIASRHLQFDRFTLDLSRGCVRLGGRDIDLSPKAFSVLRLLAENAGRLVSKQELYDAVWPGVTVTDESLVQRIRELRQLLGDDDHSLIKTVSRRGYLLDRTPRQRSEELASEPVAAVHADSNPLPVAVPLAPERRQLSIMMCDTIGSAAFIKRQDPEDIRDVLASCHRRVKEVIDRFGGFIAEYRGGRILAYFGYPTAHENDAERAIRAALAVSAAVTEMHFECLGRPLRPRVGIATGLVVVGDIIGAAAAGEHAVAGETPQLAGDMLAAAEPGAVVISASTRQLIGSLFECSVVDTKRSSAARPFEAHRVWRESKGGSRFEALRSVQTQFIGRDEELALLLRRWRQARAGEGRVVLVRGEPGIGKSRLLDRFHEALRHENHLAAWFWCWPHRTETALHPVIAYIENAAAIEVADEPESKLEKLETLFSTSEQAVHDTVLFADLLGISVAGRHPPLAVSSQRRKELLLERFFAHLAQLASPHPILIVLEDAHWIDPTTRELFDIVIERVVKLPILFIMTYRPEFSPPWIGQSHVTALTLNRLGARESAVMIKEVAAGRLLSSDVLEQIAVHTDGVPLFIEEMTKSVLEGAASPERATEEPRLMRFQRPCRLLS